MRSRPSYNSGRMAPPHSGATEHQRSPPKVRGSAAGTGAELPASPGTERARPSTGTISGLPPCGAGDSDDTFHLPPPSCPEPVGAAAEAECDLLFLCPAERVAVWDAVAAYVQEQLLLRKVGRRLLATCLLGGLGSPLALGRGTQGLFPSTESRVFTPTMPVRYQWASRMHAMTAPRMWG